MNPNFSISLSAQVVASAVVIVGQLLVNNGALFVPATLANRTLYGRSEAVAFTPYGGNAPVGFIQVQQAGMADVSVSLLAPGVASYVRSNDTTGFMERFTPVNGGTSDVIGYAEASGRVHLFFSTKTESEAFLALNGVPTATPPSGNVGNLQIKASTTAFGALAPGAGGNGRPLVSVGAQTWDVGKIDVSDANVVTVPGSGDGSLLYRLTNRLAAAATVLTDGARLIFGAIATAHATARLAFLYAVSDVLIGAKDSSQVDRSVLSRNGADSYVLGDTVLSAFNWTWNGYNLAINAGNKLTVAANNGGFVAIDTSGNILVLGSAASSGSKCSDMTLAASSTIGIGVGGLTFTQWNNATQRVEYLMPVGGFGGAAGYPFRFAQATIAGAPTSVTATQAQYACPVLSLTAGTATAAWTLILPLVLGAEFTIVNGSGFPVSVKGPTGATTTAIPSATSYKVVCYDGSNYIRVG